MNALTADIELFRAEIVRLTASPEFSSSRQLQDFLRYTSEQAFAGMNHLDQAEIARAVLGRGADFNPLEDAAVRKMASQVRQRLEHYYRQAGAGSEVVISVPVRSYVPKFQRRPHVDVAQTEIEAKGSVPRKPGFRTATLWGAALLLVVLGLLVLLGYRNAALPRTSGIAAGRMDLWTVKGDMTQGGNDAPGSAVRLGPGLREVDEISARLDFTPNREAQQAGLIVWQDANHFIRLGRKFFGRNEIEFLLEEGASSDSSSKNTVYDADGQTRQPLWLAIRRRGNSYRAYLSHDGIRWEAHGEPIVPRQAFAGPRAGIYALNGRRDAPSIRASFSSIATGWTFDDVDDIAAATNGGWAITNTCRDTTALAMESMLQISFSGASSSCNFGFARSIEGDEWEITTRVDSFPLPGRSAGLRLQGSKGAIRVARYFLNGPAISFINDGKTLVGTPDLNGSPAIVLRMAARNGAIWAGYSADGVNFEPLPVSMKLRDLGSNLQGGIRFGTTTSDREQPVSSARFYYYRETVEKLVPYR